MTDALEAGQEAPSIWDAAGDRRPGATRSVLRNRREQLLCRRPWWRIWRTLLRAASTEGAVGKCCGQNILIWALYGKRERCTQ